MIDIIIPYCKEINWNDNQLRYCLRGIDDNFESKRNVYLVGYSPDWIQNVISIPHGDRWKKNKDANIIEKILFVLNNYDVSEEFLFISDDQTFLSPLDKPEYLWWEDLKNRDWSKTNRWVNRLKNTYNKLKELGKTTFNYDTHIPVLINKKEFLRVMSSFEWGIEGGGYTINTLYFNNIQIEGKKLENQKVSFESPVKDTSQIRKMFEGKSYLGWNDNGLTDELKQVIMETFKNKSIYEK